MGCDSPGSNFNNFVYEDGKWWATGGWDYNYTAPRVDVILERLKKRLANFRFNLKQQKNGTWVWVATPIANEESYLVTLPKSAKIARELLELHASLADKCTHPECRDTGVVESDSPPGEGWSLRACPSCGGRGRRRRQEAFEEFAIANAVTLAETIMKARRQER